MQKFDSVLQPRGVDRLLNHEPCKVDGHGSSTGSGGRTSPHTPTSTGIRNESSYTTDSSGESGNSSLTDSFHCVGVNTCSVAAVIERAVRVRKTAFKAWVSASDIDGVDVETLEAGPKTFPVFVRSFSSGTRSTSRTLTISPADNESEVEDIAKVLSSFRSWYQKDFVTEEVPWFLKDHKPVKLPEPDEDGTKEIVTHDQYTDLKILGSGGGEPPSESANSEFVAIVESVDVPNSPKNVDAVEIEEAESHPSVSTLGQKSRHPKESGSEALSLGIADQEAPRHGTETELCDQGKFEFHSELQGEIQEELDTERVLDVRNLKVRIQSAAKPEQTIPSIDSGVDLEKRKNTSDNRKLVYMQRKFESIRGPLQKVKSDLANVKHAVINRTRIVSKCWRSDSYGLTGKVRTRFLENLVPCNSELCKQRQSKTNRAKRPSTTRRLIKVKFCSGCAK